MLTRRPLVVGGAGAALIWSSACAQESGEAFAGEWNGVLEAGTQRLRLRLVVNGAEAALHSLDQGDEAIPATNVRFSGGQIRLTFPSIRASYLGRLEEGRLVGSFTQGATLPLTFVRGEASVTPALALTLARLTELREAAQAPALAAAAVSRDGRSLTLADGLRATRRNEAVTSDDRWHFGSITKSITATLVARCVEAGLVGWEDTVGGVLAAIGEIRDEYRSVTFRHLLSHRAGLQANLPLADFVRFRRDNPDPREERVSFARQALTQAPHGPKEATFLYSNSGYVIAGAMLEAKLGAPWEALVRAYLFDPLGMASAGFGAPGTPGAFDEPVGHAASLLGLRAFPPGEPVTDNPAALGPAGRVHARFEDMLRYLCAHRDRTNFLGTASWDRLHTPPFGGEYALGWVKRGNALWHNGSNTLWYAEVQVDPASGVAAVAATNDGRERASSAVGAALLGAMTAVGS